MHEPDAKNQLIPGTAAHIASRIQSTLVSNCVTEGRWEQHIYECLKYRFHAAVIPRAWVKWTSNALQGTGGKVDAWIDLPFDTMTSGGKANESAWLVKVGVEEIDLMLNIGFLLTGMEKDYSKTSLGWSGPRKGFPWK